MPTADVSERHRSLMAGLVTQWRRWSNVAESTEPGVPYEDEDATPDDDREKVAAEVLGRFISALGKMDLDACELPADLDRRIAGHVRATLAKDSRPGAIDAARTVLAHLRVPATLPDPERPSVDEET